MQNQEEVNAYQKLMLMLTQNLNGNALRVIYGNPDPPQLYIEIRGAQLVHKLLLPH